MEMSPAPGFAAQLRARRTELGLTQAELAERAGISERAVSDIERGLRRLVYRDTAARLVRALELDGEAAEEFEAAGRGRPALRRRPHLTSLPTLARTALIGRAAELASLVQLLRDTQTRLVTLTGAGGVGKTRLAIELGMTLENDFPDGVVFVPLGDLHDPELVLPAIAGTLRVRSGGDLGVSVAEHLSSKATLLILDTFEHVLTSAPMLAGVVPQTGKSKLVVTSRAPLNIRPERQFPLSPLSATDAVAMFVSRVQALRPAARVEVDPVVAAAVCRRLDGLPLAIELAAARTRLLSPVEILDHLDRRFELLSGGPVDLPDRQRSIADTIAWSYGLLASDARRLLEKLAVFAGGWTFQAAEQVCDTTSDLLVQLGAVVDSSLVLCEERQPGLTRYRMLDTVREYVAARLNARVGADGVARLERRHADCFLRLAEDAEPRLRESGHRQWVDLLAEERDNIRAALTWAVANREDEVALRMVAALWMFWRITGAFSEGRAWCQRALGLEGAGHEHVRARVLWGAGWLAYQQGDFAATALLGEELTSWARAEGDSIAIRNGITLLGEERLASADFNAAAEYFDEALKIARSAGTPWVLAASCLNRSVAAEHQGELETARRLLGEAEALYRELGDDRFVARVWLQRAYLALLEKDIRAATDLVAAGLSLAAELGDRWTIAEQLDGMAAALAARGNAPGAARSAGAAAAAWESIGAGPHPADRLFTERWIEPLLRAAGKAGAAAFAEGSTAPIDDAIALVLEEAQKEPHSSLPV